MKKANNRDKMIGASMAYVNATKYLSKKFDGLERSLTGKPKADFIAAVEAIKHRIDDNHPLVTDGSETAFDLEFLSDFDLKLGAEDVVYKLSKSIKRGEGSCSISRTDFISQIIDSVCVNFQLFRPKKYRNANNGIFAKIDERVINSILRKKWVERKGASLVIRKIKKGSLQW